MTNVATSNTPSERPHAVIEEIASPADAFALSGVSAWLKPTLAIATGLRSGRLEVRLRDGRCFIVNSCEPGPHGVIEVINDRFARRLLFGGGIGFAEGYLEGEWTTPDLRSLLALAAENNPHLGESLRGQRTMRLLQNIGHALRRNSRRGSRRNIEHHYDLGNAFYETWLDRSMTYSSAIFEGHDKPLEEAQIAKYRSLAELSRIKPDHNVLEVGSGWGGFAEYAAKEIGCHITGITISREQFDYASQRAFEEGIADKVTFELRDYRDVEGRFDRVASIEMFEAVGEEYWPAFFGKIRETLKPGGFAGLQVITIAEHAFEGYRRGTDFIQRYIFPGGVLPSKTALAREIEGAGLSWRETFAFGQDYAKTLARWHARFEEAWPQIAELGFDDRFRRMWSYYLAYCEAGFRSGNTDVIQMTVARP